MNKMTTPLRWLVFVALLVWVGSLPFQKAAEQSERDFAHVAKAEWVATNIWLEAADCMRKTNAWLTMCVDGQLIPFADRSPADDPGHAFLLSLYAKTHDRPITMVDVSKLNVAINFAGFLSVAALLLWLRAYIALMVVVLLSAAFQYSIGTSPHPGFIGAAALASILPLGLYKVLTQRGAWWETLVLLSWGALSLGCAALLREPIGTMGFLISMGVLLALFFRRQSRAHGLVFLGLALLVVMSWKIPHGLLAARDAIFHVQPARLIQTHGIAHNLYIGLGAVENKFGIVWLDSSASDAVAKVDPKIAYVSEKYYQTLWHLYWQRVQEDPVEVLRIYAVKAQDMLTQPLPLVQIPLLWVLLGIVLVLALGATGIMAPGGAAQGAWGVLSIALAFTLFFVLQGVLAHPSIGYAQPVGAFIVVAFGAVLELVLRELYRRGLAWGGGGRSSGAAAR